MIAQRFPEAQALALFDPKPMHPLRALPEIEMRDHQARGTSVLGRQRLAIVFVGDESLVVDNVGDGEIGGIAAIRVSGDEGRLGIQLDRLEERVNADRLPFHVELGPFGHAADIDGVFLGGQLQKLRPGPGHRLANQSVDREAPLLRPNSRRGSGGKHGKVVDQVLAGRDPAGALRLAPFAGEAAGNELLRHPSYSSGRGISGRRGPRWPTSSRRSRRRSTS